MSNPFMLAAIELAVRNVREGRGGPFAALVVKGSKVVAEGTNMVTSANDPTAHAEIVAIREACRRLGTYQLHGCRIYTTCEPCPMCLGALYWARPDRIYYGATAHDAALAGFDDAFIYRELELPVRERTLRMRRLMRRQSLVAFEKWLEKGDRIPY